MAGKKITCPELCGVFIVGEKRLEWGMVEYLSDVVLPSAIASSDVLAAELAIRILGQVTGLRGPEQIGKGIHLTSPEWDLLRKQLGVPRDQMTPEMLYAVAICNRAILLASDVSDDDVPALKHPEIKPSSNGASTRAAPTSAATH